MKMISKLVAASLIAVSLIGCVGQPIKIASVTDQRTIDKTKGRQISGSASGFQLFLFIPIQVNNRQERAYQALLEEAHGDAITDVKITESWKYGFVGTSYRTTIEATAYPLIRK